MSFTIVFWHWWVLAAVLFILEMTLPGVVFLFLAIGAAFSGVLLWAAPDISLEWQLAVFAVFSVASALILRPTLRRLQSRSAASTLNARADALIGRTFVLDQPILGGRGRAKLGDGSWIVTGPDMAAGAKVRVASVNGTELRVEPAP
jgi:inner membrane protein